MNDLLEGGGGGGGGTPFSFPKRELHVLRTNVSDLQFLAVEDLSDCYQVGANRSQAVYNLEYC